MRLAWFLSLSLCFASAAVLHGAQGDCEPPDEVRLGLSELLELRGEVPYAEFVERRVQGIEALLERHPDSVELYRALASIGQVDRPSLTVRLRKQWLAWAGQEPENAVALYAAGRILQHHDSARAIELMEAAKDKDGGLYWAYLSLANTYRSGKFANREIAEENLREFFAICPSTTNRFAHSQLARRGAPELKKQVAGTLRAALSRETQRWRLQGMRLVWNLEFATTPPAEHDGVREQVAADLARLEQSSGEDSPEWLDFLKSGHKQAGAGPEKLAKFDERILAVAPHSRQAYRIEVTRDVKADPRPEADGTADAWQEYLRRIIPRVRRWQERFPKEGHLASRLMDYMRYSVDYTAEDLAAQAENTLRTMDFHYGDREYFSKFRAAEALLERQIRPDRALELARQANNAVQLRQTEYLSYDDRDEDEYERLRRRREQYALLSLRLMLEAHRQMGDGEGAGRLGPRVLASQPSHGENSASYWEVRALYAEISNQPADALVFYKKSMQSRQRPPRRLYGVVRDSVSDAARRVHFANGGSEEGWAAYASTSDEDTPTEGRWEERGTPAPAFSLSDLSGKTWDLQRLEGKTLLVNFWATWCGPCQAELPKLQELYEQTKDRSDVQILTMNVDEDLGLVAPYTKEKGLTMPVIPAFQYFFDNAQTPAIPTNWIIGGDGTLRWEQLGFDAAEADWAAMMLGKIDSAAE